MYKNLVYITVLFFGLIGYSQDCLDLIDPVEGQTGVSVTTSITWRPIDDSEGYIISLETATGITIIDRQTIGSTATVFTPPLGLPDNEEIIVTLSYLFFTGNDVIEIPCEEPKSFFTEDVTTVPDCANIVSPPNGSVDVSIFTEVRWEYAPRATGYRIALGTTAGAGDIFPSTNIGNVLDFDPPGDLPEDTEIFVTLVSFNENGDAINCALHSFITGNLGDPPGCTQLISPMNGETNVALTPIIKWEEAPGATSYILNIRTTENGPNDVLNQAELFTTETGVINFEPETKYYIEIIPKNQAGLAQGCGVECFSTILGCGPFTDDEGNVFDFSPEINFPDAVGICENELPTRIETDDIASGFRWYRITPTGDLLLLSEEAFVDIDETGTYLYEAYNIINQGLNVFECPDFKEFSVTSSEKATIDDIRIEQLGDTFNVTVFVSGGGAYVFALENEESAYTSSNRFIDLTEGQYTVYVLDTNGCGIAQRDFVLVLPPPGFPAYFSPNGDGIRDRWQYVPPKVDPLPLTQIQLFDRFGKLLHTVFPNDSGWDGSYNGRQLPASGYWYQAFTNDNRVFRGHFSLVR